MVNGKDKTMNTATLGRIDNVIINNNNGCTTVTLEIRDEDGNYIRENREVIETVTRNTSDSGNRKETKTYFLGIVNSTER